MFNELLIRRSTFFVKDKIVVDNENVIKIASSLSKFGLVPSANKGFEFKITPNGITQEEVFSLEMKTFNDSFKIVFSQDRIDLICNKISEIDKIESLDSFLKKTKEIFDILKNAYSLSITRVALYANICFDIPLASLDNIYCRLVNSDERPREWQLRKVLSATLLPIIQINNVHSLARNIAQIGFENKPKDRILCELDINTNPVEGLVLTDNDINNFWSYASESICDTIDKYSEQLAYE